MGKASRLNKSYILFHLREAAEEIEKSIVDINSDPNYEIGQYSVAIGHAYLHLNTAWNARFATQERTEKCSKKDFDLWRQFPSDVLM